MSEREQDGPSFDVGVSKGMALAHRGGRQLVAFVLFAVFGVVFLFVGLVFADEFWFQFGSVLFALMCFGLAGVYFKDAEAKAGV